MSVLTEAMMRLQGEIGGLRRARAVLQQDLSRQANERRSRVSALRAAFVRDRAGAHRAWFGPTLFGGRTAEAPPQRGLVEAATAKARTEEQPPATPKAEPRRHQPAKKPVAAAAPPPPSMAHLSRDKKRSFKGSKKH